MLLFFGNLSKKSLDFIYTFILSHSHAYIFMIVSHFKFFAVAMHIPIHNVI